MTTGIPGPEADRSAGPQRPPSSALVAAGVVAGALVVLIVLRGSFHQITY